MTAVASAADLPRRYAAPPPAPAAYLPPVFTWTGFYVGLNAGGAVASDITAKTVGNGPVVGTASDTVGAGGFLVGGTVGYNHQFHPNWVVGVEGDLGYADIQARANSSAPGFTSSTKVGIDGYFGTIRGRVGYAMGPWLFYGTGGWAFTQQRATDTSTFSGPFAVSSSSVSATRDINGYVVGGGVEYAVNQNLSLKAEYLYADFEKKRVVTPFTTTSTNQDVHLLKVGVNYKFSAF
jgi:outer membrane immunogenic protein